MYWVSKVTRRRAGDADLYIVLTDQISQVVHVGGKWVAPCHAVLVFWRGPVTTVQRVVERWPVSRIVLTGKTEVDEEVSCWAPRPRIPLYTVAEIFTFP